MDYEYGAGVARYQLQTSEEYRKIQREKKAALKTDYKALHNRKCPTFLGIHVSERLLAGVFAQAKRMPYGNKGFDFYCGKNKRIDVKSSCRHHKTGTDFWKFTLFRNKAPHAFLLIAFNNREDLNPEHMWLIPGKLINHLTGFAISATEKSMSKWVKYEKDLDKVTECCNVMKAEA